MARYRYGSALFAVTLGLFAAGAAAEETTLSIRLDAGRVHSVKQADFITLPELQSLVAVRAEAEGLGFSELQTRKAAMALWKTLTFDRDSEPPTFQLPYEGVLYCVSWPEDGQEDPCD